MQFKNKIVWITGASSGIGEQLVYACIKKGARVIISSRDASKLEKVKDKADQLSGECYVYPIDLSDIQQIKIVAKNVIDRFKNIDLLINNGGVTQRSHALETMTEVERKIFDTNFFGAVALTKQVLPVMLKNGGGHIAVTSSLTGKFGFNLRSSYAASKHALHGYFDSLRLELNDNNIKITVVCPGFIRTELSVSALSENGLKYGKMDEGLQNGMTAEECSMRYIRAIEKDKREVLIGGKELIMVYLKRYLPFLFYKIAVRTKST